MKSIQLSLDLEHQSFEHLVNAVEQRLRERLSLRPDRYLSTASAAEYLDCSEQRIRKLVMTDDLPRFKDGSRNLFRIDDLEEFVRRGGGISP